DQLIMAALLLTMLIAANAGRADSESAPRLVLAQVVVNAEITVAELEIDRNITLIDRLFTTKILGDELRDRYTNLGLLPKIEKRSGKSYDVYIRSSGSRTAGLAAIYLSKSFEGQQRGMAWPFRLPRVYQPTEKEADKLRFLSNKYMFSHLS
ncbi:hypothetical protein PMAYCL1PPCAC_09921, partial [Pristionchus mayeri]